MTSMPSFCSERSTEALISGALESKWRIRLLRHRLADTADAAFGDDFQLVAQAAFLQRLAEEFLDRIGRAIDIRRIDGGDAAIEKEAQEVGEFGDRAELLLRTHRAPDDARELRSVLVNPDASYLSGMVGHG